MLVTKLEYHIRSETVETAQPGDQTIDPDIVRHECSECGQLVRLMAEVVITPVSHIHTQIHLFRTSDNCFEK